MTQEEYDLLQKQLSYKLEHDPYSHSGCFKHASAYKEGILAAKSILSTFFETQNKK